MANGRSSSQKTRKKTTTRSTNGSSPKTKAKPKSASSRSAKASSQSKPAARSRSKASTRKASSSRAKTSASSKPNGDAPVAERVSQTAGTVKDTATKAASKAAGPAIAVGAAAAGVAGGVLLRGRLRRKRVLGVPLPRSLNGGLDAKSIAKTVGEASASFAKTSKSVSRKIERAGDQAERIGRVLGDDKRREKDSRSPVEVVLEGLTHRRD